MIFYESNKFIISNSIAMSQFCTKFIGDLKVEDWRSYKMKDNCLWNKKSMSFLT